MTTVLLLWAACPAIILVIGGMALVILGTTRYSEGTVPFGVAVVTVFVALGALFGVTASWGVALGQLGLLLRLDVYAVVFDAVLLILLLLVILMAERRLEQQDLERPEFYGLLLFAVAGAMFMVGAADLIVLFLGLEVMSIASYLLAGFARRDLASNEAALKYFVLGSVASAFLLFGIALLYGSTGGTHLARALHWTGDPTGLSLWLGGFTLVLIGFAFKSGLVPFHTWVPDVYQGAPTPVTTFMASVIKVAAFAPFLRIIAEGQTHRLQWGPMVWALAALTMTLGNLSALRQTNLKRMLAYSSIAQAGYLMLAVWAVDAGSMIFYLVAYAVASAGAFGMIGALAQDGKEPVEVTEWAGLGRRMPMAALAMTLFMLSLAGLPVTAGLMGKIFLFRAALDAGGTWLTIIAALNTVVSVIYYLRVVGAMYLTAPGEGASQPSDLALAAWIAIGACAVITLLFGAFPNILWQWAQAARPLWGG